MRFKDYYIEREVLEEKGFLRNALAAGMIGLAGLGGANAQTTAPEMPPSIQLMVNDSAYNIKGMSEKLQKLLSKLGFNTFLKSTINHINNEIQYQQNELKDKDGELLQKERESYNSAKIEGSDAAMNYHLKRIKGLEKSKEDAMKSASFLIKDYKVLLNAFTGVETPEQLKQLLENLKTLPGYQGIAILSINDIYNGALSGIGKALGEIGNSLTK